MGSCYKKELESFRICFAYPAIGDNICGFLFASLPSEKRSSLYCGGRFVPYKVDLLSEGQKHPASLGVGGGGGGGGGGLRLVT